MSLPIFIGRSYWSVDGVTTFSANLARGLTRAGRAASILLTETDTRRVTIGVPLAPEPPDLSFDRLPAKPWESWGARWGSLISFLEARGPCIYLPNTDYRMSCVSPRLSNDVVVVGVVHGNQPLHYDHVQRLGRSWNAIVAVNDELASSVAARFPELAERIVTIPMGVEVGRLPARPTRVEAGLRCIYVGSLTQRPKRVFDLIDIAEQASARDVAMSLTIVGDGPDAARLGEMASDLVDRGFVRFTGAVPPDEVARQLAGHDVFLLVSETEGTPNALLEAMASGCVPIVTKAANDAGLVRDGWNGFVVDLGDSAAVVHAVEALHADPARRFVMAGRCHELVAGKYSVAAMTDTWIDLLDRLSAEARALAFRRPVGEMSPPPAMLDGEYVFPVSLPFHVDGVGRFPSESESEDFAEWLDPAALSHQRPVQGTEPGTIVGRVVVSFPTWGESGIHRRVARLIRGLRRRGIDAHLLLTEESTRLVHNESRVVPPDDLPTRELPVSPEDGWGAHWGALVHYLAVSAPCVYLPFSDWRHAGVSTRLPNGVHVVGTVWDGDPSCIEFVRWLDSSLSAVIALSRTSGRAAKGAVAMPGSRVVVIPNGVTTLDTRAPRRGSPAFHALVLGAAGAAELSALAARTAPSVRFSCLVESGASAGREEERLLSSDVEILRGSPDASTVSSFDAVLLVAGDTGVSEMGWDAIGLGVPAVVVGAGAGLTGLLRDRETCLRVGSGEIDGVLEAIETLRVDSGLRARISARAVQVVRGSLFLEDDMVDANVDLLCALLEKEADRIPAALLPPPAQVNGASIFPVDLAYQDPVLGAFPGLDDAEAYREYVETPGTFLQRAMVQRERPNHVVDTLREATVIFGAPLWTPNGINVMTETLTRHLLARGVRARILLTEERTSLVSIPGPRLAIPDDMPVDYLPVQPDACWGAQWGALVKYLSLVAGGPCFYVPTFDWRHVGVAPQLPPNVHVIGRVWPNDPIALEYARHLQAYWSAIVVPNRGLARALRALVPAADARIAVIDDGTERVEGMVDDYLALFGFILERARSGIYQRTLAELVPPLKSVAGMEIFGIPLEHVVPGLGAFPDRSDYKAYRAAIS